MELLELLGLGKRNIGKFIVEILDLAGSAESMNTDPKNTGPLEGSIQNLNEPPKELFYLISIHSM